MNNNYYLDLVMIQRQNEMLIHQVDELHRMLESPEEKTIATKEFYTLGVLADEGRLLTKHFKSKCIS